MLDAGNTFQKGSAIVSLSPSAVLVPSYRAEATTPLSTKEGRFVFAHALEAIFEAHRPTRKRQQQADQLADLAEALRLYPVAVPMHIPYCAPEVLQWPSCTPKDVSVAVATAKASEAFPHIPEMQFRNALELLSQAGVKFHL